MNIPENAIRRGAEALDEHLNDATEDAMSLRHEVEIVLAAALPHLGAREYSVACDQPGHGRIDVETLREAQQQAAELDCTAWVEQRHVTEWTEITP